VTGDTGATGPTGPTGPTGSPGASGGVAIIGGRAGAPAGNAVEFTGPYATDNFTTNQREFQQRIPVGGTISNLGIRIEDEPGAAPKSWTFTIMNGAAPTAVSCTISSGQEACGDLTDVAPFAAGDLISLRAEPNQQPANTAWVNWTVGFESN
jgi:hypothetical protein